MDRNLFLALTLSATFQCLAQTPEPMEVRRAEAVFEELPELKASEILKPELLQGPHFVVRDPVPTGSGMNQFTIDSDFGVFEADGNEMLLQRLKEIDAIARLQEVSRTDEFKKSLVAAAKSPLNSARNIARDPAQAISNVPKGVMKFLGRAKETVENVGKGGSDDAGDWRFFVDLIHQGRGLNAEEGVRLSGAFLRCNFHKRAAICHAFECLEINREGGELCRRKRAAVKNSLGVTLAPAHSAERSPVDLLKLRGRFFTQEFLDRAVQIGHGERRSDRTTDWESSDSKREPTCP